MVFFKVFFLKKNTRTGVKKGFLRKKLTKNHGGTIKKSRREKRMTYEEIIYLKYKKGLSTYQLIQLYPRDQERVREIALLDLSTETLRDILKEEESLGRLLKLKQKFAELLKFRGNQASA